MARLSYQKVRYRLVKEERRLYKLLDNILSTVCTTTSIDHFYERAENTFKNLMSYAEALEKDKYAIILEMRVEIINDVCAGNSFKGTRFNERVNNILALGLLLKSMKQYSARAVFLAIINPRTLVTELFVTFGIRRRTVNVNWEESEPYEEAYESRSRHYQTHAEEGTDHWEYVGAEPNTEPDFRQQQERAEQRQQHRTVLRSPEGWPLNEIWAYNGEAALKGTTYEKVLNIESSVTKDNLRTSYKKEIRASHQDTSGSTDQEERAKQVTAAYRVAKKVLGFK